MRVYLRVAIAIGAAITLAAYCGDSVSYYESREAKLDAKVDDLTLENATLDQAVAILQEKTHANLVIDWPALQADGFSRAAKVSLRVRKTTLAKALNMVLVAFGENTQPLTAQARDGIVHIGHPLKPEEKPRPTLIYDVADFTTRFMMPNDQTTRPGNGLFGSPPTASRGTPSSSSLSRQECIDLLIRFIQETVVESSWRDLGGQVGVIYEVGGLLIITQTRENHLKVQTLLKNLRQLRAALDRDDPINPEGMDLLKP